MNRTEMIDELLERLEGELDELSNNQLTLLLSEYEHLSMLASVVEDLDEDDEDDIDDNEDDTDDELPLFDDAEELDGVDWDDDDESEDD